MFSYQAAPHRRSALVFEKRFLAYTNERVWAVVEGSEFLGGATVKGPVIYLSEQSDTTVKVALQRANLLNSDDLRILTWAETRRRGMVWPEVVDFAVQQCKRIGAVMLVVDTLGQFAGLAGDAENNAGDATAAMQPLLHAASQGLAILVSQHERKSGGDVEDSGRGSSAIGGAADIVLNLRRVPGNCNPNFRVIRSLSRFDETPAELIVELTMEGYVPRDKGVNASEQVKEKVLAVLPVSQEEAISIDELCKLAHLKRTTTQEGVQELNAEGLLLQVGKGRRNDPVRFYRAVTHSAAAARS